MAELDELAKQNWAIISAMRAISKAMNVTDDPAVQSSEVFDALFRFHQDVLLKESDRLLAEQSARREWDLQAEHAKIEANHCH